MTTEASEEKVFRTSYVAKLFGKKTVWVYWCERSGIFERIDGTQIIPRRTVPPNATAGYRCYTLQDLRDIADAVYRRGNISKHEYLAALTAIANEKLGIPAKFPLMPQQLELWDKKAELVTDTEKEAI